MEHRKRQRERDNDGRDDDDDDNEHSDDDCIDSDSFFDCNDIDAFCAADIMSEASDEDDEVSSHLCISLIVMMMYLLCSCYTVLHKVGSGNYDHGATTTRLMRLRLPDIAGHIEVLGTRAYRLVNWTDVLYRSIHCDRDCLMKLVEDLTPWLLLPRRFSEGFFNPDNHIDTSIPLATYQAMAAAQNPHGFGRQRGIDVLGLIVTFLQRVCTASAFVLQAELNLVSMSSVHRLVVYVYVLIYYVCV